jgi:hypothetical protein
MNVPQDLLPGREFSNGHCLLWLGAGSAAVTSRRAASPINYGMVQSTIFHHEEHEAHEVNRQQDNQTAVGRLDYVFSS